MSTVFKPHPYQQTIREHILEHKRCAIFAGMGLGKTSAVLDATEAMLLTGDLETKVLVIAPLRVARSTWPEEVAKWSCFSELKMGIIAGSPEARRRVLNTKAHIYTVNYDLVLWLIEELSANWPFGMVIADESTRLKGFRLRQGTQRTRALGKIAHGHVERWVNLTGTPAPNGLKDLWGQLWFLDRGQRLGRTFEAFKNRWFRRHFNGFGMEPLPFAQEQITQAISDICLSIRAEDYFDLNEPIVNTIRVALPPKARTLYRDMERKFFAEIEGQEVEAFNTAAKSLKLLQIANGAVYPETGSTEWLGVHDTKLDALESVVAEACGMPVLVAYHFQSDLERLLKAFPQGKALDAKPQTLKDWNLGKIPLLFAHPQSAGHGLNLQDGGNILAFFAHWWDLEYYQQILERIGPMRQHQAGHNREVYVHLIVAEDTIDEAVIERRNGKRSVQELLMERLRKINA